MDLLLKLIDGKKVTKEDVEEALYEMCDNFHASCGSGCIIYNEVLTDEQRNTPGGCPYFKDGKAMYEALKKRRK